MRDRDAERVTKETHAMLEKLVELIPRVRAKLRDWTADGLPAGAGTDSTGSSTDSHADPVARAVDRSEVRDSNGRQIGWRDNDPFSKHLDALDRRLIDLHDRAQTLYSDIASLDHAHAGAEAPGCALCETVRQPVDPKTGKPLHRCDKNCSDTGHPHPANWQKIYSRTAPRPPADDIEPLAPRPRCSWHYDFAEKYGVDANAAISLWHLDNLGPGSRVPNTLIRQHHPEPYERFQAPRKAS